MSNGETEIAIIGGGAAGVAAARRLHDARVPCLLVEARSRLGGRAWTVRSPQGFALDLGCGWLHSADRNPWSRIAELHGFRIDKTPPPWTRSSSTLNFSLDDQRDYRRATEAFRSRAAVAERMPDRPASEFLEPGNPYNNLIVTVHTFITGAELDQVSAHDLARYDETDENWRVVEGYGATVAEHGVGVAVMLDCPTLRIDHSGRRLRIETVKGTIAADRAVVTVPTAILADESFFCPALPAKAAAAAGLPLGFDDKLFLSLERAEEFPAETRTFGAPSRHGTGAYHLRPFGLPYIEAYFGGATAAKLEAGGDAAFFEFAREELVGVFGSDFARRIMPIALHRWGADPFARGAYSYARPGMADMRQALAEPIDGRLFFAGEACSHHDYSTAHGAYATGIAAANEILAMRRS
jgi:monoamine oxidase